MEGLAPPLELSSEVKRAIEKGLTAKQGVLNFIRKNQNEFSKQVIRWLNLIEQGQKTDKILTVLKSTHRRCLLQLLERGIRGESIYQQLLTLEGETILACQEEQARFLARLPFLLLVPLLFFLFPAYLILLFGPLLNQFLVQVGGQF
ncbi:MAG: hypothetical protein JNM39_00535 [Bdellovibrionaceae bacterium]|nr:hypothetical protein [Pseudobdellovibrionaceae bacterium]